jgi:effector-binding domain-containing protein
MSNGGEPSFSDRWQDQVSQSLHAIDEGSMDYAIRIVTTAETPTAVVTETTTWKEFPQAWPALLAEVWTFVRDTDLSPGRNVMLYKDESPTVEVGVEVSSSFIGHGRVVPSSLPAGRAAAAIARGEPSPAGLARAHAAVRDWCAANGHTLTGIRWEIYDHWLEDRDPALFETEVYWQLLGNDKSLRETSPDTVLAATTARARA